MYGRDVFVTLPDSRLHGRLALCRILEAFESLRDVVSKVNKHNLPI